MKVAIVGAGVAGLTAAFELSKKGIEVTVIERDVEVGGLAKTYKYGDYIFDSGPHRFFTTNQEVTDFIKNILGEDLLIIPKNSGVMLLGKYYDWPLNFNTILKLPFKVMCMAGLDVIYKKKYEGNSFKDFILNKYGPTLYNLDFGPYTYKFTKVPPDQIHSDWANAGISQAVIDKRIKMDTLFKIIQSIFIKKEALPLIYPPQGIYKFNEKLVENIKKNGGKIVTGSPVRQIRWSNNKIEEIISDSISIKADKFIWTAPITTLCELLNFPKPDLKFLAMVFYNVEIDGPPISSYQWCYFIDEEIIFNRTYTPILWSKYQAPAGKHSICVEVTCMEGDDVWNNPEKLIDKIKENLVKVKLVNNLEAILNIHIEKMKDTYPIYEIHYREELQKTLDNLSNIENLVLTGRCGLFWYNNMDHSIGKALELARNMEN